MNIMETKRKKKVSMNEKIIECAIELIRKNGLKFSIDELAKTLKISKKTIYKCYQNKEQFSLSIYKYYFSQINKNVEDIIVKSSNDILELLNIYQDVLIMTKEDIFNKFNINETIRNEVKIKDEELLIKIVNKIANSQNDSKTIACIIKGSLKEGLLNNNLLDDIKMELIKLLWK